jgi:hypothetical protein
MYKLRFASSFFYFDCITNDKKNYEINPIFCNHNIVLFHILFRMNLKRWDMDEENDYSFNSTVPFKWLLWC